VHDEPLPFRVDRLAFRYPALAALAGRLPLGGGREVALATLLTARLASGVDPADPISTPDRVARASSAKVWLASLALPASTRVPLVRCVESTAGGAGQVSTALRAVIAAVSAHLDGPSLVELEQLAGQLID
jgi:hypothetical protein